ncbi:hypothetical protein IV203_004655 [Nitzschia inconspicua]|uniref:Uncharacterized protein n=1 Tax=Nitzschia inconspicua TaxID=303405 RepID=A0A9K3L4Q3_9STRA|nr:hypothetical protein IV203_004655 [Nitzschia inconspicua]
MDSNGSNIIENNDNNDMTIRKQQPAPLPTSTSYEEQVTTTVAGRPLNRPSSFSSLFPTTLGKRYPKRGEPVKEEEQVRCSSIRKESLGETTRRLLQSSKAVASAGDGVSAPSPSSPSLPLSCSTHSRPPKVPTMIRRHFFFQEACFHGSNDNDNIDNIDNSNDHNWEGGGVETIDNTNIKGGHVTSGTPSLSASPLPVCSSSSSGPALKGPLSEKKRKNHTTGSFVKPYDNINNNNNINNKQKKTRPRRHPFFEEACFHDPNHNNNSTLNVVRVVVSNSIYAGGSTTTPFPSVSQQQRQQQQQEEEDQSHQSSSPASRSPTGLEILVNTAMAMVEQPPAPAPPAQQQHTTLHHEKRAVDNFESLSSSSAVVSSSPDSSSSSSDDEDEEETTIREPQQQVHHSKRTTNDCSIAISTVPAAVVDVVANNEATTTSSASIFIAPSPMPPSLGLALPAPPRVPQRLLPGQILL